MVIAHIMPPGVHIISLRFVEKRAFGGDLRQH